MGAESLLSFEKRGKKKGKPTEEERGPSLFPDGKVYRIARADGIGAIAASMLPDTGWRPPTTFPRLSEAAAVSLDTETYDPELRKTGPGFLRGNAEIIGVSVCAKWKNGERFKGYYPIRHRQGTEHNFEPSRVFDWLGDELGKTPVPIIGANLLYDQEGLLLDGKVNLLGQILDIQNAEGIIDEESALVTDQRHRGFALDKLGKKYLGRGKDEKTLAIIQSVLKTKDVKGRLRDLPPMHVGAYAEEDAVLALDVWERQQLEIERQALNNIWQLECDLVPMLLAMRIRGVAVDLDQAEITSKELLAGHAKILDELTKLAGRAIDPWDPKDLKILCDNIGAKYLYTAPSNAYPDGQPSFTAPWFKTEREAHPELGLVLDARKMQKMERDFIRGVILEANINGRIHSQFHQLRRSSDDGDDSDEEGARSGRFSSSNPNLQQVPKRDKVYGKLIRACFLPDAGAHWICGDYASQEFRLLSHFAAVFGRAGLLTDFNAAEAAELLAKDYNDNPKLDYHGKIAQMTGLDRDTVAKPLNLMLVYGAGQKKVAVSTGWITQAQYRDREFKLEQRITDFFVTYHAGVPFVKNLLTLTDNRAQARGYVRTLLGRLRHFDLWQPKRRQDDFNDPLPLALAREKWGDDVVLVRADTRKALNSIIQGSAADMTKKAMLDLWRAGFCPTLTVHDEIDASVRTPAEARLVFECMRDSVKLLVPVGVDMGFGKNWSEANQNKKEPEDVENWGWSC